MAVELFFVSKIEICTNFAGRKGFQLLKTGA
jgi:hypothetical protein